MKKIDEKTVRKMASLAKIELSDDEVETYAGQLESILEYVEKVNEVDTEGVEFKSHIDIENVLREDEVEEGLTQDEAISQSKNKNGYFVVPAVLD